MCTLCDIGDLQIQPTPTFYALFSKIRNFSSPNTPLWPNKKRSVWPSCGSILRPPRVALVIPPRRPIRPGLMKPMPQPSFLFYVGIPPPCFFFLFCVFSSRPNQSHPTICLPHPKFSPLLHFQSIRQIILTSREDLEQYC